MSARPAAPRRLVHLEPIIPLAPTPNYSISSASIDVITTGASPNGYSEERTQWGVGVDYLRGDTTMSMGLSTSEENDYTADTLNFGIGQAVFGHAAPAVVVPSTETTSLPSSTGRISRALDPEHAAGHIRADVACDVANHHA